ncbi:MAG: EamA family transporter [Rickettsiaceae bacterium]|nr:EamA family transporter [Rickettsiaceae bacterium]
MLKATSQQNINKTSNSQNSKIATFTGMLSITMWALFVCFVANLKNIPTYEMMVILYFFGFVTCATINTIKGSWSNILKHPKHIFIIGIFATFFKDLLYIQALKDAPEIHVELIIHLWPMMAIISSGIFLKEKLKFKHIIGCIIAFYGVYILLTFGQGFAGLEKQYILGYIYTFIAAVFWTAYIVVSRNYGKLITEMFAIYFAIDLLLSSILHINYEDTVVPTFSEIVLLLIMGISLRSLANFGWDFAIKKGNYQLLSILSHSNTVISVCALAFLGFAELTIYVLISTILITSAGLIACIDWQQFLAKTYLKRVTLKKFYSRRRA